MKEKKPTGQGFEDRLRQGRELRQLRSEHTIPGSPCERCRRDWCPQVCFARLEWEKQRKDENCKAGRYGR